MASKKVQVVVKATGRKQWVPERWLDHPVLGKGITLPPSARKKAAATPTETPEAVQVADKTPATGDKEN
jgi:hypothetical protein